MVDTTCIYVLYLLEIIMLKPNKIYYKKYYFCNKKRKLEQ